MVVAFKLTQLDLICLYNMYSTFNGNQEGYLEGGGENNDF